ncbi:MAG: ribonuclease D [Xanthomonadales bacterium]|nr:ribonuclease D [Xanthomonadales bacterium]
MRPGEDLEALAHGLGELPRPLFDTQLAAALAGLGFGLSYAELARRLLGVEVVKDQTRSDWLRRPLSPAQLRYAAEDVRHLPELAAILRERLGRPRPPRVARRGLRAAAAAGGERHEPDATATPRLPPLRCRGRGGPASAPPDPALAGGRGPSSRPPAALDPCRRELRSVSPASRRGRPALSARVLGGRERLDARARSAGCLRPSAARAPTRQTSSRSLRRSTARPSAVSARWRARSSGSRAPSSFPPRCSRRGGCSRRCCAARPPEALREGWRRQLLGTLLDG